MHRYRKQEEIGRGGYGVVNKYTHIESGKIVAIKKIITNFEEGVSVPTLREIRLLQELSHEHIIDLKDVFSHSQNIYLAMDLMQTDLEILIKEPNIVFTTSHIKAFMKGLLEAIAYLHERGILHLDIKPSNLLLAKGKIKLIDFGLAKKIDSLDIKSACNVVTLWYRAPELLFGAQKYGTAVDMWAVGCILAELLKRVPFFQGRSEMNQLALIFQIRGTPDIASWPNVTYLPNYMEYSPPSRAIPLQEIFTAATPDTLDLLNNLLQLNPNKRFTASQALAHPFFSTGDAPTPLEDLPLP